MQLKNNNNNELVNFDFTGTTSPLTSEKAFALLIKKTTKPSRSAGVDSGQKKIPFMKKFRADPNYRGHWSTLGLKGNTKIDREIERKIEKK